MKTIVFVLALFINAPLLAHESQPGTSINQDQLGRTNFAISCSSAAQQEFNRAVAMLHSFWYDEAKKTFAHVAEIEPRCAMAQWGITMSLYRQLWATLPTPAELNEGREALKRAQVLPVKSEREQLYSEHPTGGMVSKDCSEQKKKSNFMVKNKSTFNEVYLQWLDCDRITF